jgi:hypothetical protein
VGALWDVVRDRSIIARRTLSGGAAARTGSRERDRADFADDPCRGGRRRSTFTSPTRDRNVAVELETALVARMEDATRGLRVAWMRWTVDLQPRGRHWRSIGSGAGGAGERARDRQPTR